MPDIWALKSLVPTGHILSAVDADMKAGLIYIILDWRIRIRPV
jgi:hypothetical protein